MNREEHLLIKIAEEAGEIVQRATKALSFGLNDHHPSQQQNNAKGLVYEFNDLVAVMHMLEEEEVIENPRELQIEQQSLKRAKVEKYLAYSKQLGKLT